MDLIQMNALLSLSISDEDATTLLLQMRAKNRAILQVMLRAEQRQTRQQAIALWEFHGFSISPFVQETTRMAFKLDQSDCARPPAKFNQELVHHITMHNLLRSGVIVRLAPFDGYVEDNQTI
jgi:hypothetical protein